jgi:hypothetical protein
MIDTIKQTELEIEVGKYNLISQLYVTNKNITNALELIPGIHVGCTLGSIHLNMPYMIFFNCDNTKQLFPLMRTIDRRYGGFDGWSVEVILGDEQDSPITYMLSTDKLISKETLMEVDNIATQTIYTLQNKHVMDLFNIETFDKDEPVLPNNE